MNTLIDHRTTGKLRDVGIVLTPGVGKPKAPIRRYVEFVGRRRADVQYVVHNNTLVNILRALIERVYFVEGQVNGATTLVSPPRPLRATFFMNMMQFRNKLWENLSPVHRMSLDEFVETSPPHKKAVYQFAKEEYLKKGMPHSASWVCSFVKAEKVSLKKKSDPAPRVIQPRGVVFNLIFGCFIRPSEKVIYRAIDRVFGRPTVVCGQNAEQIGHMLRDAWDEIVDPVAVSLDLSRMDQHISDVALGWEHTTYRRMFQHDPNYATLDWCLNSTIRNVGRAYVLNESGQIHKISYNKRGSRMSGDMNTSLGNKLIMCGLLYSYYVDYLGYRPRVDVNFIDNGDDCVVIMSRMAYADMMTRTGAQQQIRRLAMVDPRNWSRVYFAIQHITIPAIKLSPTEWFRTMGFTLKVEGVVDKFEHIEFCQTQPCHIDGRWLMVRKLEALSKDCYCLKTIDQAEKWIKQVAVGGLACYGSVPIYSAFYGSMPKAAKFDRNELYGTGMYYLCNNMTSSGTVTVENRIAFYNTFGVTPREQEVIEAMYNNMTYGHVDSENPGLLLPLPLI
jgi:hypothetical protein